VAIVFVIAVLKKRPTQRNAKRMEPG